MNLTDCFYLGYIQKGSDNSNRVVIKLDTDQPQKYNKLESVLIQMHKQDQSPVPFFIEKIHRLKGDELSLDLNLAQHFPNASFLKGLSLYLLLDQLEPLKGNAFYFHEIIGFKVEDELKGSVGVVKDVYESTAHPVLAIEKDEKEILIPLNDEVLRELDKEKKIIYVSSPEGLIDLYLD